MKLVALATLVAFAGVGCASGPRGNEGARASTPAPATAAPSGPAAKAVKSKDGSFTGEVSGTPVPNGRFARLQIGMSMNEAQQVMGRGPDRVHSYESGKRWIPFYFGNDARRLQALYRGEGCLIFTGGNVWGGAGGDLVRIDHDAAGACYQP